MNIGSTVQTVVTGMIEGEAYNITQDELVLLAKDEIPDMRQEYGDLFTADQLGAATLGASKHYIRGKIGFGVDILWLDSSFVSQLGTLANQAAVVAMASASSAASAGTAEVAS